LNDDGVIVECGRIAGSSLAGCQGTSGYPSPLSGCGGGSTESSGIGEGAAWNCLCGQFWIRFCLIALFIFYEIALFILQQTIKRNTTLGWDGEKTHG